MLTKTDLGCGIYKLSFGNPEKITPFNTINPKPLWNELEKMESSGLKLDIDKIVCKKMKRGCVLELPLEADEALYGFGLQLKSFKQNGKKKQIKVNSDPMADTGDSHAPAPFYVSTKGYGVYVDSARYMTFYCGSHKKTGVALNAAKAKLSGNTDDLYARREDVEGNNMIVDIPTVEGVDIYIFEGPSLKDAVSRYNLFSGGGAMPPYWGLGMWYRPYGGFADADVLKLAEDLRADKIPCTVMGFEPGWQSAAYSCSHVFDEGRFPDPDFVIKKLKEQNYNINLWDHIFTHPTSPIYEKLKDFSGDYEVWNGLVPDLSVEEAKKIWVDFYENTLVKRGISGFKIDECDSSDYCGYPWSFPDASEFPSGMDGELMHSLMGVLLQKANMECFDNQNLRTWQSVRSGHSFAAPYPFALYSDLYDHADFIRGVASSAFAGHMWSPEVRQCDSEADLIRRIQSVILSPIALVNSWMIPIPPWKQYNIDKNLNKEIMENAEEITQISKKFFDFRMSLIPYLYSVFAEYKFSGVPAFRPLVMEYPMDSKTYDIDNQWLIGKYLLAAPLTAKSDSREVYLPEGMWYDFWTNEKFEGGKTFEITKDLSEMPLFVKEGALLPLAKPVEFIDEKTVFDITVNVYGNSIDKFVLFEDDGLTNNYLSGEFNRVTLSADNKQGKIVREHNTAIRKYNILDWKFI